MNTNWPSGGQYFSSIIKVICGCESWTQTFTLKQAIVTKVGTTFLKYTRTDQMHYLYAFQSNILCNWTIEKIAFSLGFWALSWLQCIVIVKTATSLKLFPLMEHPKDDHNYCPLTFAFWCIFPTLEIVCLFILTWFWKTKHFFQVGKNEKIKQDKIKICTKIQIDRQ